MNEKVVSWQLVAGDGPEGPAAITTTTTTIKIIVDISDELLIYNSEH